MTKLLYRALFSFLFILNIGSGVVRAQSWQWVATQTTSSTGNFLVNATGVDASGNIIVTGQFSGTITLGSITLTSAGSVDIFVAKLSSTGNWLQAVRAGGPGLDLVYNMAVDGGGNAIITGLFRGATTTFGTISLANTNGAGTTDDLFVARLNAAGTWTQAVKAGGSGSDYASKVVLDVAGNATVIGFVGAPSASFGPSLLTNGQGLFVARLSASGIWTQVVKAGNVGGDIAYALSVSANGDAWIGGSFSSPTIGFGTTTLTNTTPTGTTDGFIAHLNAAGTWTQAVGFGGADSEAVTGIDADANGTITVAGSFRSAGLNFGSIALANATTTGTSDIFVAQYTNANRWAQAARAGGLGSDGPSALAVDGSGNIFVAGGFRGPSAGFGPFSLVNYDSSGTTTDIFVASLNSSYNWTQALQAGGNSLDYNDACTSLALTSNGGAIAGGTFNGTSATFGPFTFSHPAGSGYVARLAGLPLAIKPAVRAALFLAPNPAHTTATFALEADKSSRQVLLLDALGRLARTYPLPARAATAVLDLTGLAPGLYVVRCGAASGKLVVE